MKLKNEMIESICKELILRKYELENKIIDTIYFGGGTPSILEVKEIELILDTIQQNFKLNNTLEITLEVNPDDLTPNKIKSFKRTNINRLSIGVQSFFDEDLRLMNRSHTATQAKQSIKLAQDFDFKNITIDLIYGIPNVINYQWLENLHQIKALNVPHVSAYALTVEPKTILQHQIKTGKVDSIDESLQRVQFDELQRFANENGFVQYEISNFGKPNFFSKHNSSYWLGDPYLGVGPSAHSYHGEYRSWNIANNKIYIDTLIKNELPLTTEILTETDQFNESIMIGLRTIWGVDLEKIKQRFSPKLYTYLMDGSCRYIEKGKMKIKDSKLILEEEARFLADGIASDLFYLNE